MGVENKPNITHLPQALVIAKLAVAGAVGDIQRPNISPDTNAASPRSTHTVRGPEAKAKAKAPTATEKGDFRREPRATKIRSAAPWKTKPTADYSRNQSAYDNRLARATQREYHEQRQKQGQPHTHRADQLVSTLVTQARGGRGDISAAGLIKLTRDLERLNISLTDSQKKEVVNRLAKALKDSVPPAASGAEPTNAKTDNLPAVLVGLGLSAVVIEWMRRHPNEAKRATLALTLFLVSCGGTPVPTSITEATASAISAATATAPASPDTQQTAISTAAPLPTPEAQPTYTGAFLSNRGGGDGISLERVYLPANLPPALMRQFQLVGRPGEGIGDKLCPEAGLCYFSAGGYPLEFSGPDGKTYKYDPTRSGLSETPVYTTTDGEYELVQVPVKIQDEHQIIMALDSAGKFVYLDLSPDGSWKVMSINPLQQSLFGGLVTFNWEAGTITLPDGKVVSMVETDISLPRPTTYAECLQICPQIKSLDDLQRIQLNLVPLDPNPQNFSYSFYRGENSRGMNIYSPVYLGAFRFEWNGVPAVAAALEAINRLNGDTEPTVFYVAHFIDGSFGATIEDADKLIQDLASGNFQLDAVTAYLDPTVSTDAGFLAAIDLQKKQGIYDLNGWTDISPLEFKIIPIN